MTRLYINDKLAIMSEDMSIELISENPYFTQSSSYSLDVRLPMPVNEHIFGHIERMSADKKEMNLPMRLIVNNKVEMVGTAVLTDVEDDSITVQLVSGNSEFNLKTNEDIYIDELQLRTSVASSQIIDDNDEYEVPVPVKYEDEVINSYVALKSIYGRSTPYDQSSIVTQPKLIPLVREIVQNYGYEFDEKFFEDTYFKYVFICNAVTRTSRNYLNEALPHWYLSQFFTELENFFFAVFVVDDVTKTAKFVERKSYFKTQYEYINSDDILDEFKTEISSEEDSTEISSSNVKYNFQSAVTDDGICRLKDVWLDYMEYQDYNSYEEMESAYSKSKDELGETNFAYVVRNIIFRAEGRQYINWKEDGGYKLKEVNLYCDYIRDESSETYVSLNIVPAKMTEYNIGYYSLTVKDREVLFKKLSDCTINIPQVSFSSRSNDNRRSDINIQDLINGTQTVEEKSYKDVMEVALYTGKTPVTASEKDGYIEDYPIAFMDSHQTVDNQELDFPAYSLSMNTAGENSIGARLASLGYEIGTKIKHTFTFRYKGIPSAQKIYVFHNKSYACKQIKVTIDSRGVVDNLVEGEFYPYKELK
jgi:hypothetical protein